jgi:hypothetical protein
MRDVARRQQRSTSVGAQRPSQPAGVGSAVVVARARKVRRAGALHTATMAFGCARHSVCAEGASSAARRFSQRSCSAICPRPFAWSASRSLRSPVRWPGANRGSSLDELACTVRGTRHKASRELASHQRRGLVGTRNVAQNNLLDVGAARGNDTSRETCLLPGSEYAPSPMFNAIELAARRI